MPNSDPTVGMRDVTELSDLVVTGELSLQETGRIVTSTDTGTNRVWISSTGTDKITFWTTDSTGPGAILGFSQAGVQPRSLWLVSPGTDITRVIITSTQGVAFSRGTYDTAYFLAATSGVTLSTGVNLTLQGDGRVIQGAVSSTYDPALQVLTGTSQPSVGATVGFVESGLYSQMGSQVIAHVTICWSSAGTPGNGVYVICPPKKIHSSLIVGGSVGGGRILDASGNDTWVVDARKAGSTKVNLRFTGTTGSNVTNASPFACGSSDDQFDIHLSYLTTE